MRVVKGFRSHVYRGSLHRHSSLCAWHAAPVQEPRAVTPSTGMCPAYRRTAGSVAGTRQQAVVPAAGHSHFVWLQSRPSGRPTAMRVPRVTLCVKRCTKWSMGLAPCTSRLAIQKLRANILDTNSSSTWFTYGMSAITCSTHALALRVSGSACGNMKLMILIHVIMLCASLDERPGQRGRRTRVRLPMRASRSLPWRSRSSRAMYSGRKRYTAESSVSAM